ncbi:hypothetical protein G8A07_27435 [Roseateles sp. DAIF2]|uniref:hypothetical protein n=1 Tax=Roseateles sp. DAIF2 TaxID=2714952 RepID=UPI0018A249D0|nr:hypothetical protein [Roseateles sp. DAIF2]QPF76296.1 hypothetical protein G8A07_27435 [Roseateles sp. DAIF2]
MRHLLFIASLLMATAASAGTDKLFSRKGPLKLDASAAPALFRQCSRDAPTPKGKVWLPSPSEIATLQRQLIAHLQRSGNMVRLQPDAEYRGQYAAFRDGKEIKIYAAFVAAAGALPLEDDGQAQVWCDGGSQSWGIVYWSRRGSFQDFRINGNA